MAIGTIHAVGRSSREFTRDFNEKLPGFETDIHGLAKDATSGAVRYYVDCLR